MPKSRTGSCSIRTSSRDLLIKRRHHEKRVEMPSDVSVVRRINELRRNPRDQRSFMCPVCITNAVVAAVGVSSTGGLTAFAMKRLFWRPKRNHQTNETGGKQNEIKESPESRVAAGVGGCAPATAREREEVDSSP